MPDNDETPRVVPKFDFLAYPADSVFYDRRTGLERRDWPVDVPPEPVAEVVPKKAPERRARKERRRRIDPTTFEKQYTDDEMEFMTAIQRFKTQSGKSFPSFRDVLRVATGLGYRRGYPIDEEETSAEEVETCLPL
jgi:hypothetical protein